MCMTRRRLLFASFLLCVFAFISFLRESLPHVSNEPRVSNESHVSNGLYETQAIISLASSSPYLDGDELPAAVESLTLQTSTPKAIHIYLPSADKIFGGTRYRRSTTGVRPLSALIHSLVEIHFVEDVGPATKFIPVLKYLMDLYDRGDRRALDQPVIIVDKYHAYSPLLVSTLMSAHAARPSISVGFQGWRIRPDLRWGVLFKGLDPQVQHCDHLAEPYRIGVLTANEGYLVTPRMFLPPISSTTPSPISASAPILNTSRLMSSPAHFVDDIWMAGSLATQGVSRYVIPLPGAPSLNVTEDMAPNGTSRQRANTKALEMFKEAFIRENLLVSISEEREGSNGSICVI